MRFVQYRLKSGGLPQLGGQVAADGEIFELSSVDPSVPNNLVEFLALGTDVDERAKRIIASGSSGIPLKDVDLLPPITKPDKVVCVGLNYRGHCDEQNIPYLPDPMIFNKFPSCIIGPYDNIQLPTVSNNVDWEVELGVVIGKKAKGISSDQVQDYIFGYTVAQDLSARDWERTKSNQQVLLGKSMDTFCPLGPAVVTKDELDPENLWIRSWVNGNLKQDGRTSDMTFKIDFLISYLSQIFTLYPGDILLTGTPPGVGLHRDPPEFLQKGDILESEIEGIGKLRNSIV